MVMAKFTVDTTAKLFIAKPGITSFDVKIDFYSDSKEHWLSGGTAMGFLHPIRVIGGDSVGSGKFAGDIYFLRDGWKIRPDEADHTLLINGNLFLDEGEAGQLIVPTVGGFTVIAIGERSNLVLGIATGALAPTQQQIRDAMALATAEAAVAGSIDARLPAALAGGKMDSVVGPVALTPAERTTLTNAILDLVSIDGYTLREIHRLLASAAGGKSSGGASNDTLKGVDGIKDRVVTTIDANGHRTAVTLDLA